ncbi:hypothetical protein JXA48_01940 [Candidatus Woesearchaeota archaeon]|nr:hypothetical protein [Candidatus Woesearchaeota archaeon]
MNKKIKIFLFLSVLLLLNISLASALISSRFVDVNGNPVDNLIYDRSNTSYNTTENNVSFVAGYYGSDSYMDDSGSNPNLFLEVCHPNLTLNDKIDLVYATEDRKKLTSVLTMLPEISSYNSYGIGNDTYQCATVDVDLSGMFALYPGHVLTHIIPNGTVYDYNNFDSSFGTYLLPLNDLFFNGSYKVGVSIQGPPKVYYFSVVETFDQYGIPFTRSANQLMTSFLRGNGSVISTNKLTPSETFTYPGEIVGGETVYVNGLLALELKVYDPCSPINDTGYYILNSSEFSLTEDCILVNRTDNVVINFAGEVIDGDGDETNGSKVDEKCSVRIEDSQNVTLENFFVQDFYYGLCVKNSTVLVYGTGAYNNYQGAKIYLGSNVKLVDLDLMNNDSEIKSFYNSTVELVDVNFTTAHLKADIRDAMVKAVPVPPPSLQQLNISTNSRDINQYIQVSNMSVNNSYAQISFYYTDPMPNKVTVNNISIYKYNGSFYKQNDTVYIVNGTPYLANGDMWANGNWTKLFTTISPSESLILGPMLTSFSVFAPFGYSTLSEGEDQPGDGTTAGTVPKPEPDPQPKPEAGSTQGGGGTPAKTQYRDIFEVGPLKPIVIQLDIPKNVTLMQGEAGEVIFNISNLGDGVPDILTVGPKVLNGWEHTNSTIYELLPDETRMGSFMIAPYEKQKPGTYQVPIHVWLPSDGEDVTLVKQFMDVTVIPRGDLKRIRVEEYPPEIQATPFSEQEISFNIKNIGDAPLDHIIVKLDSSNCLLDIQGNEQKIKVGSSGQVTYKFSFADKGDCDYNLKFYDGSDLIGFVPLKISVSDKFTKEELIKISIMTIIVIGWTALSVLIISRRRKQVA